ncbi:MAG: cupin domain-containing protein [Pseudomonadota bacterium]
MQIAQTVLAAALVALATTVTFAADKPIINKPAKALDWQITQEGVAFAALSGDRFKEAYMAMVRLPAGLVSPPHTKSANMFGVVVSGTLVHHVHGETDPLETPLQAGSFYKIPAHLPHVSKCVSDTDCVTFLYQDGSFDFLPVDQ